MKSDCVDLIQRISITRFTSGISNVVGEPLVREFFSTKISFSEVFSLATLSFRAANGVCKEAISPSMDIWSATIMGSFEGANTSCLPSFTLSLFKYPTSYHDHM